MEESKVASNSNSVRDVNVVEVEIAQLSSIQDAPSVYNQTITSHVNQTEDDRISANGGSQHNRFSIE